MNRRTAAMASVVMALLWGCSPARAATPAGRSLASLRSGCYGERTAPLSELAVSAFLPRARQALASGQAVLARDLFGRVLRGGHERPDVLRAYGQALSGTGQEEDARRALDCAALLELLAGPPAP